MKLHRFLLWAVLLVAAGCSSNESIYAPQPVLMVGLGSPVWLDANKGKIVLGDYFPFNTKVDSATADGYTCVIDKNIQELTLIPASENLPLLSEIHLWVNATRYTLVAKQEAEYPITITIPDKGYKSVKVKGEFNAWNVNNGELKKQGNGNWSVTIFAPRGSYQYCMVIDGKEKLDPTNSEKMMNNMGGLNSLYVMVGETGERPELTTLSNTATTVTIGLQNGSEKFVALWENYSLPHSFIEQKGDSIYTITIPQNATSLLRSHLRVWASNQYGVSNDVLVPLENGKVIENPAIITRGDKPANILYSLMVDRFMNGDTSNDRKLNSPEVLPKVDFFGGDIAGITQKIREGFFTKLGVNTLWISPIIQNPDDAWGQHEKPHTKFSGYHGYWPISLTQIDRRFGTEKELHELLEAAHERNINVLLDWVANHLHISSPILKEHPNWATSMYLLDGRLNLELWDEERLTTWFDKHLPTLDLSNPNVAGPMSDSAVWWIKNFDIDGFRHDATKHIDELYWRLLTKKIKQATNRSIFQIGETYGSPELINSYVNTGMLNAQFDFNLYDAAVAAFSNQRTFGQLWNATEQSLGMYGHHHLMGNITGNHDRVRFISYADGSVSFKEDGKQAGWDRTIEVKDEAAYKKLLLLHSFFFSIPGVPVIFYGDEYGQAGANDPDNRRWMQFDNYKPAEQEVLDNVKKLTLLRHNLLPLTYGDTKLLHSDNDLLVVARTYFGKIVIYAANKGDGDQFVTIDLPQGYTDVVLNNNFDGKFIQEGSQVTIELAPNSFDYLNN